MLRLVFTVCMIGSPDICEQREMLIYERMTLTACVAGAMPELAVWRETHPNWRIARWRCEDDRAARSSGGHDSLARRVPPAAAGREATPPGAVATTLSR